MQDPHAKIDSEANGIQLIVELHEASLARHVQRDHYVRVHPITIRSSIKPIHRRLRLTH